MAGRQIKISDYLGHSQESAVTGRELCALAEFLSAHAVAAYQVMGANEDYENARYLWRRIESSGQDEMSKRDLFRLCKGKFKRVEDMDPALQILITMG